jgi:hypothetical protein
VGADEAGLSGDEIVGLSGDAGVTRAGVSPPLDSGDDAWGALSAGDLGSSTLFGRRDTLGVSSGAAAASILASHLPRTWSMDLPREWEPKRAPEPERRKPVTLVSSRTLLIRDMVALAGDDASLGVGVMRVLYE